MKKLWIVYQGDVDDEINWYPYGYIIATEEEIKRMCKEKSSEFSPYNYEEFNLEKDLLVLDHVQNLKLDSFDPWK